MMFGAYKHFYDVENKFMAIETITTRAGQLSPWKKTGVSGQNLQCALHFIFI